MEIEVHSEKASRYRFTIAQKVELLDLFKKGLSRAELSRMYNIPSSTLTQFISDEAKIRELYEKNDDPNRYTFKKQEQYFGISGC